MPPQVRDAGQCGRRVAESRERRDRWREFARVVKRDAVYFTSAGNGNRATSSGNYAAHAAEDINEHCAHLGRVFGPALDGHRTTGNQRCRQEGCRVGEVGFDIDLATSDLSVWHHPDTRFRRLDFYSSSSKGLDGHGDVSETRQSLAGVTQRQPVVEPRCGEQEARDELT